MWPPLATDQTDRCGLPLTTHAARAAALYRDAIDRVFGAEAGAEALLDRAVACDPAFTLAHVARWMLAHANGDKRAAHAARDAAMSGRDGLTAWELGHLESMAALIERQPDAWTKARAHLLAHPGDLLLASQLVGDLFFHGGERKREVVMDLLRSLAPHHRDDWAFQARLGFHTSELGDPGGRIALLECALAARPQATFVAHAMAHALLESGERAASYRFLRDWVSRHDPAGPIDGHIHWHLSLGELEHGQPTVAIERYLRSTAPGASHCAFGLQLADAGGLFCRMALDGTPPYGIPRAELRDLIGTMSGALRIPFVAVHVSALALVLGEPDVLDRCVDAMDRVAHETGRDAEYRVVTAFRFYAAGDLRACVEALEGDREHCWEAIGGSNEERALIAKLHARASAQLAATHVPARESDVVTGLARILRAPLVACVALACMLSTASCAEPRSTEMPRPAAQQPRVHHVLGIGTCTDDVSVTSTAPAFSLSPLTAPLPPPQPSAERCDALPDSDGAHLDGTSE